MDLKASYFLPLWRSVSFGRRVSLECFSFNQGGWKKKKKKESWLNHMIEFLDPDSSTPLGSALWSEICTERRLCVILKAILCPWESRWGFIFVPFWVFCFKPHTLQMLYLQNHPRGKSSYWGGGHSSQLPTSSYLWGPELTLLLLPWVPTAKTSHPLSTFLLDSGNPRMSGKVFYPAGPTTWQWWWEDRPQGRRDPRAGSA